LVTCTASDHKQDCNDGVQMCLWCVSGIRTYFIEVCIPVETVTGLAKLRSARHGELIVPLTRTKTFGSRSFRSAVSTAWNNLPHHIRQSDISREQFTSHLKTWLFSCQSLVVSHYVIDSLPVLSRCLTIIYSAIRIQELFDKCIFCIVA